jgi:hypothetical protein
MSCDYSTYHTAVNLDPCSSPNLELGDCATARRLDLERRKSLNLKQGRPEHTADQSKAKGHRHLAQSRIIPDSTETDPVYVWGDEGPIND